MSLQVTGKNINVGETFRAYVSDKLDAAIDKYLGKYLAAHVRVEKERGRFHTSCSVRVRTGLMLESSGEGTDAYASADAAFEHLEKRLRRYKRRLKNRHHGDVANGAEAPGVEVNDFVVQLSDKQEAPGRKGKKDSDDNPLVIAENARTLLVLSVSEAVMRLDLTEEPFLVFRNAGGGEVNVVYRRPDGNIGWIDAAATAGSDVRSDGRSEVRGGKPAAGRSGFALAGQPPSSRPSTGGRSKRSS